MVVDNGTSMVIEWLKVKVAPELREQYVQKDDEIWTSALSRYSGFLGKEVWISSEQLDELILVIRWASFEAWNAIPEADLQQVEAQFDAAMGEGTHEIVEARGYQVRKFVQA